MYQSRTLRAAALLILLMIRLRDQPLTARQIAETTASDYETTRKHLRELSRLGIVTETRAGWMLTVSGFSTFFPQLGESAEIPRFESDTATSAPLTPDSLPLKAVAAVSAEKPRIAQALEALSKQGISQTNRVRQAVENNPQATAAYIDYHAQRLRKENRFTTSLLICVIESGDPAPNLNQDDSNGRRRHYIEGKYADHINH